MTAKVMDRTFVIQNSKLMKNLTFLFNSKLLIKELDILLFLNITSGRTKLPVINFKSNEQRVNCFTGVRNQRKN